MALTIELPHVGESVVEGTIGKWLKQPGDAVRRYEPLVEVITDKVTMEVPSPVGGSLLRVFAEEGETIPMGAPLAEMETDETPPQAPRSSSGGVDRPQGSESRRRKHRYNRLPGQGRRAGGPHWRRSGSGTERGACPAAAGNGSPAGNGRSPFVAGSPPLDPRARLRRILDSGERHGGPHYQG